MVTKLNPKVVTDDMMYEGGIQITPDLVDEINNRWRERAEERQRLLDIELVLGILEAAKTNKTLQSALEECIIIYKLSKEYKDGI